VVKGEKEKCMNAGMNAFIGKPFDENELVETIAKLSNRAGAAKQVKDSETQTGIPASLYDLSKLWDISRGKQSFVEKMINIFITETANAVRDIKTAYEKNDIEKIGSIAHKIKPSLYNLNINSIREEILKLELLGKEEGAVEHDLKTLVEKVENVLNAVIEKMKTDAIVNPG
jgi:HPt (histidine-containing phosphotransfer) domain-containing protein